MVFLSPTALMALGQLTQCAMAGLPPLSGALGNVCCMSPGWGQLSWEKGCVIWAPVEGKTESKINPGHLMCQEGKLLTVTFLCCLCPFLMKLLANFHFYCHQAHTSLMCEGSISQQPL